MRDEVSKVTHGRRWWVELIIGFLGGATAMFAITQATRIMQFMAPMDNIGLLQVDLIQACSWGIFSAIIYALSSGKRSNGREINLYFTMSIVSVLLLSVGLMLTFRINGTFRKEVLMAVAPLLALGPLSATLCFAWSQGLAAVSRQIENV